jgi:O-antigen/teichoic acid export membrane protein
MAAEPTQDSEPLRTRLIRAASGSFGLSVASTGLAFVTSVVLARMLGAAGYGIYNYALSWIGVLALPAVMGFDRLLVRETARYRVAAAWGALAGLLRASNSLVIFASSFAAIVVCAVTWLSSADSDPTLTGVFLLAALLLPMQAVTRLRQSTMGGLERVVTGQVPELLVRPLLFLVGVLVLHFVLALEADVRGVMAFNVAASFGALCWAVLQTRRALPEELRGVEREYHLRAWAAAAAPMLLIGGTQVVNSQTDVIMLGLLRSPEEVGVYTVASRGTRLILLVMVAINTALGPVIARVYASGDLARLQNLATRSARGMFAASLPLALGLIVFGYWFLLIFGPEFTSGRDALSILCVGKMINVLAGSAGTILVMTGYEKQVALWVGLAALLNIVLNALLIPIYGIEGAAFTTALCESLMNIAVVIALYRRIKIHSTAFGNFTRRPKNA